MKTNKWVIAGGIVVLLCTACICILALTRITNPVNPTPTTANVDISTIVFQTAQAASTQTALFVPASPTLEVIPTFTSTIPAVTFTLTESPTPTATIILPTIPQIGGCSCTSDLYNCQIDDFSSQSQAQACFNSCMAQGVGDIHGLDGDGNGLACEDLP